MTLLDATGISRIEQRLEETPRPAVERDEAHWLERLDAGTDTAAIAAPAGEDLISKVGQLTRKLHETLRELGYDSAIERAAHAIPDARDGLGYVASMTEQAAIRTLTAVESARPIQGRIGAEAGRLGLLWNGFFEAQHDSGQLRQLAERTVVFLEECQRQTRATNDHLLEVVMAQEFQDLTGQVIRKVAQAVQDLEQQMLKLLIDNVSTEKRQEVEASGILIGPVIDADGRQDVVANQAQVDDLLESLGF